MCLPREASSRRLSARDHFGGVLDQAKLSCGDRYQVCGCPRERHGGGCSVSFLGRGLLDAGSPLQDRIPALRLGRSAKWSVSEALEAAVCGVSWQGRVPYDTTLTHEIRRLA